MRLINLVVKNLLRNKLRTLLTALAVIALVFILSMITTVVGFLESFTEEKNKDVKLLINERYRLLSNFNRGHVENIISPNTALGKELRQIPGFHPDMYTVWHFVGFTLDPDRKDPDKAFFVVATYPDKIRSMTDNLKPEEFDPAWVGLLQRRSGNIGMVMGGTIARKLNKRVGDTFPALSTTHFRGDALRQPIQMEFEIVGLMPEDCSWNDASFIDVRILDTVLQKEKNEYDGKVSYAWLQVDDQESADRVSRAIERQFEDLRCETAATAYSRFMAPLQGVFWGIKWILVPAIVTVMMIILANTFSLTVRERQTEVAVLKVLGFRAKHILGLVMGEAVLVGALAGMLGAVVTFAAINFSGGIRLTGMPVLLISPEIFWRGPLIGLATGFVGGIIPAIIACWIRVTDAFARTA